MKEHSEGVHAAVEAGKGGAGVRITPLPTIDVIDDTRPGSNDIVFVCPMKTKDGSDDLPKFDGYSYKWDTVIPKEKCHEAARKIFNKHQKQNEEHLLSSSTERFFFDSLFVCLCSE